MNTLCCHNYYLCKLFSFFWPMGGWVDIIFFVLYFIVCKVINKIYDFKSTNGSFVYNLEEQVKQICLCWIKMSPICDQIQSICLSCVEFSFPIVVLLLSRVGILFVIPFVFVMVSVHHMWDYWPSFKTFAENTNIS